jgi:SAM-dependent methyltransferase
MNAFEHYSEPKKVASELLRVLKPGGWIVVQTAFLQPEHEYPWHFYNTTSEGLRLWFRDFNIEAIRVSDNFNPLYSLGWLASECEASLRQDVSADAADRFRSTPIQSLVEAWNHSRTNKMELWEYFHRISQEKQRAIAAGFELLASKPIP